MMTKFAIEAAGKKISQRAIGDPLDSSICSVPTYDNSEEEDSWTQPE